MTRYGTPGAFRQALETRLYQHSRETGLDLGRLRRGVVFERILVRLGAHEPHLWVLKGGVALEVRLRDRARTTKDLDLVIRQDHGDVSQVRERIDESLAQDAEGDGFGWELSHASELAADLAGRPGWRFHVDASLAGREFAAIRMDVVARPDDVGSTERLALPNTLAFDGFPGHDFETVAPPQHFAEKLHALTRDYGRENSRTRDLVDLVLLIENRLVEPASVLPSVRFVFGQRRGQPVPEAIADVPEAWDVPYATMAGDVDV